MKKWGKALREKEMQIAIEQRKNPETVEISGFSGKSTVRGYNAPCFDSVVHIFGSRFDALGQWGQKGQNINTAERIIRAKPHKKDLSRIAENVI